MKKQKLYGLLGEKLSHSFSPEIHSRIFNKTNRNAVYHLFEIKKENVKDAVKSLEVLGINGVNVTIPYKVEIMKYLDQISLEAQKIGAVNTIVFKNNKSYGCNTDYHGFGMMLDKFNIDVNNKKAVILGTGGASKAVYHFLYDNNISQITYVTRNKSSFNEKFKECAVIDYDELNFVKNKDIIINCTPCGMFPNVQNCPVDKKVFKNFSSAVDLIYNPKETKFLEYAREENLKTVNGLYMLIAQAVKSQNLWINEEIKDEVADEIYEEF